jgi:hypothetical protein
MDLSTPRPSKSGKKILEAQKRLSGELCASQAPLHSRNPYRPKARIISREK